MIAAGLQFSVFGASAANAILDGTDFLYTTAVFAALAVLESRSGRSLTMLALDGNANLQLTWDNALQARSGSLLASTLGASATVGCLRHAAERQVRWAA